MNSLQAGLIGVSVLVIALFAAWMWWQSWRGSRTARKTTPSEASRTTDAVATSPLHSQTTPNVKADSADDARARVEARAEPTFGHLEVAELETLYRSDLSAPQKAPAHATSAPNAAEGKAPAVLDVKHAEFERETPAPALLPTTSQSAAMLAPKTVAPVTALPIDERLNVFAVVTARDGHAIDCEEFVDVAERTLAWGRVFRVSAWEEIEEIRDGGAVQSLCLALPIASRAGPLSDRDAIEWKRSITAVCDRREFDVTFGGDLGVGERAHELDQFLAAADVICVLYLVRKDSGAWSGTRLRGTLEANGFRLQADGRFVYFEVESESPIFSAVDGFERSFSPERLRTENVTALRLVFEASNVEHPIARFDVYRQTLRALARLLEAEIKDSGGAVVGDTEFTALREEVVAGSAALAEAGIECGSPAARALFR
ncbi:MAG: hypothetical protein EAZ21_10905 [Betaproteobacteria bacterium]|nr:MAG: hypothetical protein EAZ21_10905 [Betaproteobacteria bacterium]